MKPILTKWIIAALVFVQFATAQNGFQTGNAAYRKNDFKGAAAAYESVLAGKKESAELYFNLGNAYYKLHQVAPSIYSYEKALQLDPNDKDIKTNLEFARKMAIDDIREVPKVGFSKIISDLAAWYPHDRWAWIAVVFAFVSFGLFLGYYFAGSTLMKRLFFAGMFTAILVVGISFLLAVFARDVYRKNRPAIVFAEVAPVKSEPKDDAQDVFVLHEGAKVHLLDDLDNWRRVELPDETQGWILAASIKEIK